MAWEERIAAGKAAMARDWAAFSEKDEECFGGLIPNSRAQAWLEENVPVFRCSDRGIEEIYAFRWWTFRKHLRKSPEGYFFTEFLPDVPWAGRYNTINAALGFHVREGRWLRRGAEYVRDYLRFWMTGSGELYSARKAYSCWIGASVWDVCDAFGDDGLAREFLEPMTAFFRRIEAEHLHESGLFWSCDDWDAMEDSISGSGLRPTLNSYMAANALAIARTAEACGREDLRREFLEKAAAVRGRMEEMLWDGKDGFYKVLPLESPSAALLWRRPEDVPEENNVMEEIGFIPWMFDLPGAERSGAFRYLLSEEHFKAPYGPRTADRAHPRYGFEFPHECLWNGPSWPFATSQTLIAAGKLLKRLPENGVFGRRDWTELLGTYAGSHWRVREDGVRVPWIDEDLDPDTGDWIARTILRSQGWPKEYGGYERGKDYNHSCFCDLVITGLCGVTPGPGDALELRPLAEGIRSWALYGLPYHGRLVDLEYDDSAPAPLAVRIDGREVYRGSAEGPVVLPLKG